MKKKFYLAARLADLKEASGLIARIEALGTLQCSYNWTFYGSVMGDGEARYREIAVSESEGVLDADIFFFLAPGARGSHVEFGIAVAKKIPIVILYHKDEDLSHPYPSVFYHLPQVIRHRFGEMDTDVFLMTLAGG